MRKLPTGPLNYVALGDSTGAGLSAREGGYVARIFQRLLQVRPGSKLTNLCSSGATTSDVLKEQVEVAVNVKANLITLGIGINDVGNGFTVEKFEQNYERILAQLVSGTDAVIIVTNIPDISISPRIPPALRSGYQGRIMAFNQKLEEAASRIGVPVFDIYRITHDELPKHPEYLSGDGFHPSDKGYEIWAEQMWPTVAQTLNAQ